MVGHVLPLVPLARALRDAGHDILFATAHEGVQAARKAGIPVQDVAPGLNVTRVLLGALLRRPRTMRRELAGEAGTAAVGSMFAALAGHLADRTAALADDWRPDLVLHEGLAPLGGLAAARRGVPSVLVDALVFDGRELFDAVTPHLDRLVRRFGVDAVPEPAETVVAIPPSLAGPRHGRPMRYVPATGGDGATSLPTSGSRPVVLVSRSTVSDPRPDPMMARVVAAAEGADVDVVLVRPDRAVARRSLPPNVTTTDWVPFADVLPRVAGFVHHGGAGSLMTALAAGVPQVVVPGAGDRTVHARLLAARGAGLAVPAKEITRDVLERLVSDAGLRQASGEVAAEIAAMPAPADLVEPLVALAAGGHPAA
ncbi:MAG: glycosyltransferase [Blastococcus sp.]|jgi:UDP:flavonoid glycosyltransferase YjiC (YdhE family)|nr:glycosyltransferase [Blastococcus sp.]